MWLPIAVTAAGFTGFLLAGAALRLLSLRNDKAARLSAQWSVGFEMLALALGALWLSAAIFWPLDSTNAEGVPAPALLLRAPMIAMAACSALAMAGLPAALLVLRAVARRAMRSQLRAALARQDEEVR